MSAAHARLFAGELNRTRYRCGEGDADGIQAVLTPTGLCCRRLFFVGVLLEVEGRPGDLMRGRVADPTGAFTLQAGRKQAEATAAVGAISLPAFVAVTGTPLLPLQASGGCLVVPEAIRPVTRGVRDGWVIRTASATVGRLEVLAAALAGDPAPDPAMAALREYRIGREELREIGLLIRAALESLRRAVPETSVAADPREAVQAVLAGRGPKAQVPLEEIVAACATRGLDRQAVLAGLAALLEEGECYMPRKDCFRLV